MKYIMVMIICLGVDCQAIYNSDYPYETYDQCLTEAIEVTGYMPMLFPSTSGEIHCMDKETFSIFETYIEQGGDPAVMRDLYKGADV